MSITEHHPALGVSRDSDRSSDQARTVILNLSYPTTRPTGYAPWACPPKPLVIRPTLCTRYEATFIYSNGTAGLVGHNYQSSISTDSLERDTLGWIKRAFSRHVSRLRRKVELAKARLSVALLRRRN